MLVVYLSNRYIKVVSGEASAGRITVKNMLFTVDTGGCILNGTVTDEDGFVQLISSLWDTNKLPRKGVRLVIGSSQFTTKVTAAPMLKPKQMMEYVSREFTDVGRISDPVYGYFPLPGKQDKKVKVRSVFAMAAERSFIRYYMDLFARMGIAVDNVESSVGAVIRLLGQLPQVKDSTCIVQFVDDVTLMNFLIMDGEYVYSSRSRVFSEPGTPGFAGEISRAVGDILQFAKAQNLPQEILNVYAAGIPVQDWPAYQENIGLINRNIQTQELSGGKYVQTAQNPDPYRTFSNFALAVGGLIQTDGRTTLMNQMSFDPRKEAARRKRWKIVVPLCIAGGVMALIIALAGIYLFSLTLKLRQVQEYNWSEEVVGACERYDSLNQEIRAIASLNNSMLGLQEGVLEYPKVDSGIEEVIEDCARGLVTARLSSYQADSGVISFDTSAPDVYLIHQFIHLLSERTEFASVDYTGYSQDSEGTWRVKVNCTMAARMEEQAQ